MGNTFVISGLRNKRARIAGEIVAAQRAIDQRREELAKLDAVILMFSPDCNPDMIPPIRPGSHGLFFGYSELSRICIDCLREAKGPVRHDRIVDRAIEAKGFAVDARLRKHIADTARQTLNRMVQKGVVRRVLGGVDAWWELVG